MTDCGIYEDEDFSNDLLEILKHGWLRVWDIRYVMKLGEETTR